MKRCIKVKNGLQELDKTIEPTALPFWKRAWQYAKIAYKIKGNYALKQKFFLKMNDDLALLQEFYKMDDDPFFKEVLWTRLLPSPFLRPSIPYVLILRRLSKMSILSLDLF